MEDVLCTAGVVAVKASGSGITLWWVEVVPCGHAVKVGNQTV